MDNIQVVQIIPADGTKAVYADPNEVDGQLVSLRELAHWALVEVWDSNRYVMTLLGHPEPAPERKRTGVVVAPDGTLEYCEFSNTFLGYVTKDGPFNKAEWSRKAFALLKTQADKRNEDEQRAEVLMSRGFPDVRPRSGRNRDAEKEYVRKPSPRSRGDQKRVTPALIASTSQTGTAGPPRPAARGKARSKKG